MSKADRIGIMERRRALEAARNMLYSKIGKVVLDENKFPDRTLELEVKRIDVESKKNSSLIDNDKKMFKRARLIYNLEPTILIERPATPPGQILPLDSDEPIVPNPMPNYMAPVRKPEIIVGVPAMPATIDAFTVLKRKTKNVWETKYTEEDMSRKFRSIIMKSPPLSEQEHGKVDKGYSLFRPPSRNEEEEQKRVEEKRRDKIQMLREIQRSPSPDAQLAFITQLERDAFSRASKSVRTKSALSQASSQNAPKNKNNEEIELHFNPFHLERFDKMRRNQKQRFYNKIKKL